MSAEAKAKSKVKKGFVFYQKKTGPGYRLRWYKCHVRAIVDDHVVYRWWSLSKQYWRYQVESVWGVEYSLEHGSYVTEKPKDK